MSSTTPAPSTNIGPLTTTFTPSLATCTSTFYARNDAANWLALAQDSNMEACMPPQFNRTADHYYSPAICPTQYSYACEVVPTTQNGVVGATTATCCPSSFTCVPSRDDNGLDLIYGCYAIVPSNTTLTIASTSYGSNVVAASIVTPVASGDIIYAYGVIIARASNDPAWQTSSSSSIPTISSTSTTAGGPTSTSTTTPPSTPSTGLSGGAKAGIAVGVVLGALLLLALGFFIFRKRRQARGTVHEVAVTEQPFAATDKPYAGAEQQPYTAAGNPSYGGRAELESGQHPTSGYGTSELDAGAGQAREKKAPTPVYEM